MTEKTYRQKGMISSNDFWKWMSINHPEYIDLYLTLKLSEVEE